MIRPGGRSLVVGATGQDGSYLSQLLLDSGQTVHVTSRQAVGTAVSDWERLGIAEAVTRHQLDPSDRSAVASLIEQVQPDAIYVLCGQSSVGRSFDLPAETMISHVMPLIAVCEGARLYRPGCHIMLAASGEVFGETGPALPAREDSPFRPLNAYASAKVMAVEAARAYRDVFGLCVHIAYLFNHESPLRPAEFVFGKVRQGIADMLAGRSDHIALGNGNVVRDWGWAPDYCAAIARLAALDTPQEVILATGRSVSLRDAVEAMLRHAGLEPERHVRWSDAAAMRRSEAATMHADPTKATQLLGWTGSTPFPDLAGLLLGAEGAA